MQTEDEIRPGAGGYEPLEDRYEPLDDHGSVGDLWTEPLVEVDDSIDCWCYHDVDAPRDSPAFLDRTPRGPLRSFHAAQCDDDGVLDQWLASIAPDQFEQVFECLASLEDGPLNSSEPTA